MFRGERKWLVSETRVLLDGTRLELRRMKEEIVALREEMWAAAGGAAPGGTGGRGRAEGSGRSPVPWRRQGRRDGEGDGSGDGVVGESAGSGVGGWRRGVVPVGGR